MPQAKVSVMKRVNLEEIRQDGKEPRKFAYLCADEEHPRPRIHQLEHFADHITDTNRLEAVVVSKEKFKEICGEYKKVLEEDGQLTKEHRREIEEIGFQEGFFPEKRGMLLFYHPQMNELRGREVHPPEAG